MNLEEIRMLDGKKISTKKFEKIKKSDCVLGVNLLGVIAQTYYKRGYEYKILLNDNTSICVVEI